jgi:hypothetical protein
MNLLLAQLKLGSHTLLLLAKIGFTTTLDADVQEIHETTPDLNAIKCLSSAKARQYK